MYNPPGADAGELGDIDVIGQDDAIHLFHLVLPNHDRIAHALSHDGLSFKPLPDALRTGDPGSCDDDMLWTMHVVPGSSESGRRFHMYYTACATAENGQVQRVAMAMSDDLIHWEKHAENPILEAAPPHYNASLDLVGFVSFRDPFVFTEADRWHMLVSARESIGPRFARGCIAHATSADGIQWQLKAPLYAPRQFEDLEVASLLHHGNHHQLFFHDFAGHSYYRIASSLNGPWRVPEFDMLLPELNAVFRFCKWRGKTLLYHWLRSREIDWPRRASTTGYCVLAPPKEVEFLPSGEIALHSFTGWLAYHHSEPTMIKPRDFRITDGVTPERCTATDDAFTVRADGRHVARAAQEFDHFILETTLRCDAGRALGIVFRSDAALESVNWLKLDFETASIELHRTRYFDSSLHRYKLKSPSLVQSMPARLVRGKPIAIRILACAEHVEVSVDGIVRLCAATYHAKHGAVGVFVENADATFAPLQVQPLTVPFRP